MAAHVAVVGAGPAGCAAAVELCRAGVRVTLLDRHSFPRERPCCGLLLGDALAELEALEVRTDDLSDPLHEVRVLGGRAHAALETDGLPEVRVTSRARVDHRLAKAARAVGAELREGALVEGTVVDGPRVVVRIAAEDPLFADVVLAADGPAGALAPLPTERQPSALYRAGRLTPGQFPAAALGSFGRGPALAACATRTREGTVHVGLGLPAGIDEDEARVRFAELLAADVVRDVVQGAQLSPTAKLVALPAPDAPRAKERVLYVGEAAGGEGSLFGGIGPALAAGRAAGRDLAALLDAGARPSQRALARVARRATRTSRRARAVRLQVARELEGAGSAQRLVSAMQRSRGARRAGLGALLGPRPSFSVRLEIALLFGF